MGSLERHRNKLSVMVCKELFVPIHFQWLKLLLHVFSDSPFVMLSHRGGGHTNHLLFQASLRTCLIVIAAIGQRVSLGWLRSLLWDSGGTSREGELCSVGGGGFFSLCWYCINGIPGMGCGKSHQHVLQLATPEGVFCVFHESWVAGVMTSAVSLFSWLTWEVWVGESCDFWVGFVLCLSPWMLPWLFGSSWDLLLLCG